MFQNLPTSWTTRKIGELCDVSRGSSPRPIHDQRYFENGTIPWIKIADATKSGKFLYETKQYVNEFGASFSKKLPSGTIIVAASGTLGYTQILGIEGCAHDGWLILQNLQELDRDFAYYTLQLLEQHFYNSAYGAAIQNINTTILRETEIPYPPLPNQRKIAAILSAYDDLIENNTRRIRILEEMAQTIYREWFIHFRYPGHEGVPLVDSPLGEIPQGWEVCKFTDIISVMSGGTPKTSKYEYWGNEIPWFTPQDLTGHYYSLDTKRKITNEGLHHCSSKLYPTDTVFITARGTVGKCTLAGIPMAMSQTNYALIGKDNLSQFFIFLTTLQMVDLLKKQATGAVFDTIIGDTFRGLIILKPSLNLIDKFHRTISSLFILIKNLLIKNENLRVQRDLLLPRLIRGELDVEEIEIEIEVVTYD